MLKILWNGFENSLDNSDNKCYDSFRSQEMIVKMPACRNGRRGRLKICCGQPRAGSSPAAGMVESSEDIFVFRAFADFKIILIFLDRFQTIKGGRLMKSKVVLLICDVYDEQVIYEKLKKAVALLGGTEHFAAQGERVLLKPKLVRKADVSRAVMTHPAVLGAVARLFYEAGYTNMHCGDSCGVGTTKKVMAGTGMDEALLKYGVSIRDFDSGSRVAFEAGTQADSFVLADEVREADAVINVCKMKTHALERITGAVKNMYGCVYGLNKAKGHTLYPTADSFARMLVDLNKLVKPGLHVMDGIVAMEGNGPTSGEPRAMNVLLVSDDAVALDSIFCRLIHLQPEMVPTIYHGGKMGLGVWQMEDIELLAEDGSIFEQEAFNRLVCKDFKVDRRRVKSDGWVRLGRVLKVFQKKPYIKKESCVRCGVCVESCPVDGKALSFKNGRNTAPVYDYKKCIRCFCCQEMCPHKAIDVKRF